MPSPTRGASDRGLQPPTQSAGQCTIGVVAEPRYFRESLVKCLAQRSRTIALDLGSGDRDTFERVAHLSPNVVLVDAPQDGRGETIQEILRSAPDTRIVMLGVPEEEDVILCLAEAGVAGFISPAASLDDLLAAIESALRSELTCSPKVAAALLKRVASLSIAGRPQKETAPLTTRERQIIQMIEAGLSNKEIAQRLMIGAGTVKTHVHHILEKLEVHRRGEAAACVERVPSRLRLLRN